MKTIIHVAITMVMTASILLAVVAFGAADTKPANQPDPAVSRMTDQFDFNKQPPVQVSEIQANTDVLHKEIIDKRLDKNFLVVCLRLATMLISYFVLLHFIRKAKHSADDIVHTRADWF